MHLCRRYSNQSRRIYQQQGLPAKNSTTMVPTTPRMMGTGLPKSCSSSSGAVLSSAMLQGGKAHHRACQSSKVVAEAHTWLMWNVAGKPGCRQC